MRGGRVSVGSQTVTIMFCIDPQGGRNCKVFLMTWFSKPGTVVMRFAMDTAVCLSHTLAKPLPIHFWFQYARMGQSGRGRNYVCYAVG